MKFLEHSDKYILDISLEIDKKVDQAVADTILFMTRRLRPDLDADQVLKDIRAEAIQVVKSIKS